MDTYNYDPMTHSLDRLDSDGNVMTLGQRLRGRLQFILGSEAHGPVDRSEFVLNRHELHSRVDALGVEVVDTPDAAEDTVWLPNVIGRRYGLEDSLPMTGDAVDLLAKKDRKARVAIANGIGSAKATLYQRAAEEAWWFKFANKNEYRYNPFQQEPTEQYVFDDKGTAFNLYNFSQPITKAQLSQIASTIDLMSQLTNGLSTKLVPNMVIHEAFMPKRFSRSGHIQQPGGQAWLGTPFIELHASALVNGTFSQHGSMGQTWLQQVMVHEITHQIDEAADQGRSIFGDYFEYIDHDGDKLVDETRPRDALIAASPGTKKTYRSLDHVYGATAIKKSVPHRDYGLSSAAEDLSVTAEELAFGGRVDDLRRDAFIRVLQRLVTISDNERARQLGRGHPDYRRLSSKDPADHPITVPAAGIPDMAIERRIGKQIFLPAIDRLRDPLKIMVAVRPSLGKRVIDLLID